MNSSTVIWPIPRNGSGCFGFDEDFVYGRERSSLGPQGVTPDLDLHCERVNHSAEVFKLKPMVSVEEWIGLTQDGLTRFDRNAELYIRPMYWAETGSLGGIRHDPDSTRWCLCIYEAAIPKPTGGAVTLSPYRRPTAESAPVEAKAGCLYPNNARAIMEAQDRGFDNCLMCDMLGHVAELGSANVFMAKDGWFIHRRSTAPSSTASPASASSGCCAAMA